MKKSYNIFIPELVPLDNKGEEAIVRGIADVLFPSGNCEIHLFDEVEEYRYADGIHVYPVKWFISPWLNREFGLGLSWEKLRDSSFSLIRNAMHKLNPSWVKRKCSSLRKSEEILVKLNAGKEPVGEKEVRLKQLLDCDYIIAGHDGALDDRVCQVLDTMSALGKRFGVFGVEFPMSFKSDEIVELQHSVLQKSEFFYCRTEASHRVTRKYFPTVRSEVLADPAFGMIPSDDVVIDGVIKRNNLGGIFSRPVVMCTSCEPPPISRYCFEGIKTPNLKLSAHRDLFADLIKYVVEKYDANILFLPHAIGPGRALDDRVIARDILRRSGLPSDRAAILDDLLSAKELKGLIGRADMMIAERIHSMIGSVGVNTPFLCMGSKTDRRINGIINGMLGLENNVYFLNRPDIGTLIKKFDEVWLNKQNTRAQLSDKFHDMKKRLEERAQLMRGFIV